MPASVFIPSGAGAPGFGGIQELLLRAGYRVCAGDKDPNAYGRGLIKDFWVMPGSDAPDYVEVLISTAYNPLFAGTSYPDFRRLSLQNVHHVTCKGLRLPVVTLNGFNSALPAGPITLDNVIVDNISPNGVSAQFASIVRGPGNVNFMPGGTGVTVTNMVTSDAPPKACVFPTLPAPHPPAGWSW